MQAHQSMLVLCAIATGAMIPFQAGANAVLGRTLGHPFWGTAISLCVSLACIVPSDAGSSCSFTGTTELGTSTTVDLGRWHHWRFLSDRCTSDCPTAGCCGFYRRRHRRSDAGIPDNRSVGLDRISAEACFSAAMAGFAVICIGFALMQMPELFLNPMANDASARS